VKRASIDVVERCRILVLDSVLERADRLSTRDFDREYVAGIIAMNEAVEFEDGMNERIRLRDRNYTEYS
jgi:hypothetical protein